MSSNSKQSTMNRRAAIKSIAGTGLALASGIAASQAEQGQFPVPPDTGATRLAQDEAFWREVATYYDRTEGIINLEHGYWGKMAKPVLEVYQRATAMVNAQNSYYARKQYGADMMRSTARVADALGVNADEIVLTRNATEAIHALLLNYQGLQAGDSILFADIDYPSFQSTMRWLEANRGVKAVQLTVPNRASQSEMLQLYRQAFEDYPSLKLALLTHASNQQGMVLPIEQIAQLAGEHQVDVVCDCAQSWGLLNFQLPQLAVNWAGFNLHKWIGSPVGVGALYMHQGTLHKVAPYPGELDPENTSVARRVHPATSNFAANLAIPAALDFHQAIGAANKEARLRYLRGLWTNEAENMSHIEVLGGGDEAAWSGLASFRLRGKNSGADVRELQQRLEHDFGIFTVARYALNSGACIRITPQVFTSENEIATLVEAMRRLA